MLCSPSGFSGRHKGTFIVQTNGSYSLSLTRCSSSPRKMHGHSPCKAHSRLCPPTTHDISLMHDCTGWIVSIDLGTEGWIDKYGQYLGLQGILVYRYTTIYYKRKLVRRVEKSTSTQTPTLQPKLKKLFSSSFSTFAFPCVLVLDKYTRTTIRRNKKMLKWKDCFVRGRMGGKSVSSATG